MTCRCYYKYTGGNYYCNNIIYNSATQQYTIAPGGNFASSTNNGLSANEVSQLTLFYRIKTPEAKKTISLWNSLFKKGKPSGIPGHLIHSDGYDIFEQL